MTEHFEMYDLCYTNFDTGDENIDIELELYLFDGREPNEFVSAILTQSLYIAATRLNYTGEDIVNTSKQILLNMPSLSFGNSDKFRNWILDKDGRRTKYVEDLRSQQIYKKLSNTY